MKSAQGMSGNVRESFPDMGDCEMKPGVQYKGHCEIRYSQCSKDVMELEFEDMGGCEMRSAHDMRDSDKPEAQYKSSCEMEFSKAKEDPKPKLIQIKT